MKIRIRDQNLTAGLGGGGGGAAAAGLGASAWGAAAGLAAGASPVILSLNNCCPDFTVSPSDTKISSMIP